MAGLYFVFDFGSLRGVLRPASLPFGLQGAWIICRVGSGSVRITGIMLAGEWPLANSSFVPVSSLVPSEPLDDLALKEKQMTQNVNLLYVPFWCEGLSCCGSWMSTLCLEPWRLCSAQLDISLTLSYSS